MRASLVRPAVAVLLAASVAAGGAALAAPAPAPVCNQIVDDKGDAAVVTDQPGMDIVSADVASDAKQLVAVIRLADKPNTTNVEAVGASRYYVEFIAKGSDNPQYLSASIAFGTGAATFRSGEITPSANGSTFTNDAVSDGVTGTVEGNIITIKAQLAALTRVKPAVGTKITGLNSETFSLFGVLLVPVDDAAGPKPYTAGAPTCVKL
jgi:hypothetical protein